MAMEVMAESSAKRVLPVPPAFSGCIARLEVLPATPVVGGGRASRAQLKVDCEEAYKALLSRVLGRLISAEWVIGGAGELDIVAGDAEVRKSLQASLDEQFSSQAAFERFLRESGENVPDLLFAEREFILGNGIRAAVNARIGPVTPARVVGYYRENLSQFAVAEQRDLGFIRTKSAGLAGRVERELRSGVSFASVARRFAGEQPVYADDGLLAGLEPHVFAEQALNDAIFGARAHVVSGPVRLDLRPGFDFRSERDIENIDGYYVFEVQSIKPAYVRPFAQVRAMIAKQLPVILEKRAIAKFIASWRRRWAAKTDCSPGFVIRKCRQYKPTPGEIPEDAYTLN